MKKIATITNEQTIEDILNQATYGTLALCENNKPYCLPINFVPHQGIIYFHGAKKGQKITAMKNNNAACLSVVEDCSLLPSYFSNDTGDACPATHLFQSVYIEGNIEFVEDYKEKAQALEALMQKLQKEGKYIPLSHKMYEKAINATCIFKLIPSRTTGKVKLGQHFTQERYENVKKHLLQRGQTKDLNTLAMIDQARGML
jgi:nitroimidazol reductase NimA-like FMN-containing flavoprotein (pyridoxamine 5'-phosphate oxidase superfamily)